MTKEPLTGQKITPLGLKQKEGLLFTDNFTEFPPYTTKIAELLNVPTDYQLKEVQTGIRQNGQDVIRLRYAPIDQSTAL